jgi:hypothetical protein
MRAVSESSFFQAKDQIWQTFCPNSEQKSQLIEVAERGVLQIKVK